ncbi:MAG: DHCW motif cupin fold protein [Bifidobacterium crudilactis]|nr:DHCW motif cupin fold protein [Bifidobacterium crudilactis]
MKLPDMKFKKIDWLDIPKTDFPGEKGAGHSHTDEEGDLRTRVVTYEPGFVLDHYCQRGHIVYVLEGEFIIDLADGRIFTFQPGSGLAVSDGGDSPHRIRSVTAD